MKNLFIGFQAKGNKGPIFEDGPNFDMAFKLFHGNDGVVPLSGRSELLKDNLEADPTPFNPLAAKAATISLSAFGPGGPFSFNHFSEKWNLQKKKSGSSKKRESTPKVDLICFWLTFFFLKFGETKPGVFNIPEHSTS